MSDIIFQASEPSDPGEEDFRLSPIVFLWFKPRTPWGGAILDLGPLFEQTWLRTISQSYIPNFKHLSPAVWRRFLSIFHLRTQDPRRRTILDPKVTTEHTW